MESTEYIISEMGRKFDTDKPQYSLLPPEALLEVVKVLTFGAQKYAPDNWRYVDNARQRYFDAANRHMWQWWNGESYDEETMHHHLASAISNLMFVLETELNEHKNEEW